LNTTEYESETGISSATSWQNWWGVIQARYRGVGVSVRYDGTIAKTSNTTMQMTVKQDIAWKNISSNIFILETGSSYTATISKIVRNL